MTNVLHIDASAHHADSTSRAASASIVAQQQATSVTYRDLAADPLPFIDAAWADARLVPADAQSDAERATLALSDALVQELKDADTIIIGTPLYNFGAPATLKAWMDLVARPRVTFQYLPDGPVGLLKDKKAILTVASGGVPVGSEMDLLTPHLKLFLGFLGIDDVSVLAAKDVAAAAA